MHLGNVIRYWANWNPDGEAVVIGDTTVSWSSLNETTSRIASALAQRGIKRGDRIGILANNCLEYLELAVAGYKLGSVLVPLNVRLTPPELRYIIDHASCSAVVADGPLAPLAAAALDELNADVQRFGLADGFGTRVSELKSAQENDPDAQLDSDDLAYICYTSGTTGTPKGAMLSHGNVLAMAYNTIVADDITSASRAYLPFPLSFTGGLVSMWAPNYVGGTTLVLDTDVDPARALATIEAQRITNFNAVPVIWEMLLSHPDFGKRDLSSLKVIGAGGAAVPEALLQRLQHAGLPMTQGYGLTEGAGKSTWLRAEDAIRKLGSCGRPLMHTQVRTVDETLNDVPVGEIGELLIKGPEVMLGYWDNPKATAETIVDDWLRTGDLARIDEEGYVFIADRAKDMLISGGLNVYPAEIEAQIVAFEGIAECAVIGVPDEKWGERPAALINAKPGEAVDTAALMAHCRENLADYKLPRYIVARDQPLPRGMSGKVLKRELREEYADVASLGEPVG